MRRARIKVEGTAYYHCMSRIIEHRFIMGETEKERFRQIMRQQEGFTGLEILTYCIMDNHFHILLNVPQPRGISDRELIRRLAFIYEPYLVRQIAEELEGYRAEGQHESAERLKARYTYRMHDVSEFFKTVKQRFSQWYNRRNGRSGPLWEQRFKSILVEGSNHALSTMAAYIDLNPIRAALVSDPEEYRHCGYGEAMGGSKIAREGIRRITQTLSTEASWARVRCLYRKHLYIQGQDQGLDPQGRPIRSGFSAEEVQEVLRSGGDLPVQILLRCRVRYFSDGLALGSRMFVEGVFRDFRDQFSPARRTGARAMKHGDWRGLFTARNLRLRPVSMS